MNERIRLLQVWIALKEQLHPFLLSTCPLLWRYHQGIAGARKQFWQSVAIRQPFRNVCLVLADGLASALVLLAFLSPLETFLVLLCQLCLEELTLLVLLLLSLFLVLEAQFLHGVCSELLHVESIKCDGGIWEALKYNLVHSFREVHCNLTHLASQIPMNPHKCSDHILNLRSAYDGNQSSLASMGILV